MTVATRSASSSATQLRPHRRAKATPWHQYRSIARGCCLGLGTCHRRTSNVCHRPIVQSLLGSREVAGLSTTHVTHDHAEVAASLHCGLSETPNMELSMLREILSLVIQNLDASITPTRNWEGWGWVSRSGSGESSANELLEPFRRSACLLMPVHPIALRHKTLTRASRREGPPETRLCKKGYTDAHVHAVSHHFDTAPRTTSLGLSLLVWPSFCTRPGSCTTPSAVRAVPENSYVVTCNRASQP